MAIDLGNQIATFFTQVVDDITNNLYQKGISASGGTAQSIAQDPLEFEKTKDGYVVKLYMPDYYAYLDEGVKGTGRWTNPKIQAGPNKGKQKTIKQNTGRWSFKDKPPPIASMRAYMKSRAIVGDTVRGQRGTSNSQKQLNAIAGAMAKSIQQQGIKQTNFYSDVVNDELFKEFEQLILDELGVQILVQFEV